MSQTCSRAIGSHRWLGLALLSLTLGVGPQAVSAQHSLSPEATALVLGSFREADRAERYRRKLASELPLQDASLELAPLDRPGVRLYRVLLRLQPGPSALATWRQRLKELGIANWRLFEPHTPADARTVGTQPSPGIEAGEQALASPQPAVFAASSEREPAPIADERIVPATQTANRRSAGHRNAAAEQDFDLDLGLQSRNFFSDGAAGQSRWHPSLSLLGEWFRDSASGRHQLKVSPFLRLDGEDSARSHGDLREAFYSYVGDRAELHIGARQIFWGVTEFKHLVDVINQTDLVENVDGEDKLGQPMVELVLNRDFGNLHFYLLTGARERTFPGGDGRLRFALPIAEDDPEFESGAGRQRIDGAVRWSHYAGPLDFGLYHFSGTNRDPLLKLRQRPGGTLELVPHYGVIDQTGLDAQLLLGDWAFKLEALTRSGDGERFAAANLGFERTLVGVFGSRSDLGLVLEYLWDERGDGALNTLFERDLALGARWALNDSGSTQALFGAIWDTKTDEYVLTLEASREIGQDWRLALEGRAFAGSRRLAAVEELRAFEDGSAKSAFLQQDDFLQLELTRFF